MIELTFTLFGGILLGLSLAAPPGPMNAVIAEQSVLGGWGAGFRAGLGAMVADLCFLFLSLLGFTAIVSESKMIHGALLGLGGGLMIYFAYGAVKNARKVLVNNEVKDNKKGFRKAFVLAITNPYQIIWWLSAGIALLKPGKIEVIGYSIDTGSYLIITGLFLGIMIWILFFPLSLKMAKNKFEELEYVIAYISSVILFLFGITFLYDSLTKLIGL